MSALSVAVWGLGPHAIKNILPALAATPGVALRGVCSRNAEVVAGVQRTLGCAGWHNPDEMLADTAIDAVYVSTPIGLHSAHGTRVLTARKQLWCEKPLAGSEQEAASLVELSRAQGMTVAEGFMYLYHPQLAHVRQVIASGRLGALHSVTCRFGIPALERPGFRNDPALGGGAFLDVGCYPVSAVLALFPAAVPAVVFSEISIGAGSAVDTAGRALLRVDGVTRAILDWGVGRAYRNEIDVWGTGGSLFCERAFSKPADYVPRFRHSDNQGNESLEQGRAENHFVSMFTAFRGLVDDGVGAELEREQILRRSRLMDRIRQQSTS